MAEKGKPLSTGGWGWLLGGCMQIFRQFKGLMENGLEPMSTRISLHLTSELQATRMEYIRSSRKKSASIHTEH
jgi:hypothetical protein